LNQAFSAYAENTPFSEHRQDPTTFTGMALSTNAETAYIGEILMAGIPDRAISEGPQARESAANHPTAARRGFFAIVGTGLARGFQCSELILT
jgi:hypothetical protein